ncbi:hypothetical protein TNCV_1503581 [Trichonephila clavipes]|uniref:Uncharacterized protein n=1 Tax=Trichonephila clavipes TaxID=2585209 RepID=A0A8X6RTH4_TRICX|nr:hypothetical protein TNCV_1503581 [Trichonephila clavipes]
MGSNPGEDMDVCKCIVPLRHGDTLNSRRASSPHVRLVGREERHHIAHCHDEFRGPLSGLCRSGGISNNNSKSLYTMVDQDWWCRAGRGNAVKTRRVEQAVVSWPLPKNYSSRSYESSLDGAASECSNK